MCSLPFGLQFFGFQISCLIHPKVLFLLSLAAHLIVLVQCGKTEVMGVIPLEKTL